MNLIQLIILSFFDIVSIYMIIQNIIQNRRNIITLIIYSILFSIALGFVSYTVKAELTQIALNLILMVLMISIVYRKNIKESVYLYVITSIIIIIVQLIAIIFMNLVVKNYEFNFVNGLLSQSLGIILVYILSRILPIKIVYQFINQNNGVFKQLAINIFLVLFSILIYWHLDFEGIIENIISISVVSTILVFINLVIIKNGLINESIQKELSIYKRYNPIIEDLIDEIRARQHDFDNNLHALNVFILNSNLAKDQEIKNYTKELNLKNSLGNLIKLKSKLLASLLFSKKKIAEQKNIRFMIDIESYSFNTNIKEFEIVEMLAIIIDNAMETNVANNEIHIKISEEDSLNVIIVENKHPYIPQETLNKMFEKNFSTKGEKNRGYGLYNLKKIINRVNGSIIVKNEKINGENYVIIKLIFN